MPRDIPIIFSAPMVAALLAGRKTQTRRLATSPLAKVHPGDRLWVRENFATSDAYEQDGILGVEYAADGVTMAYVNGELHHKEHGCAQYAGPWKPSIHMPRWASRLTLVVEEVRFQALQDISEADAWAEGVQLPVSPDGVPLIPLTGGRVPKFWAAREFFTRLWDSLHAKPGDCWDDNPAVVALTFAVHRANIDALTLETSNG